MNSQEMKKRTRLFALRIMRLCESLPAGRTAEVVARQLIRCGTSVSANYRAATRAKSFADFIAKLCIVEEECDECIYWIELLIEGGLIKESSLAEIKDEAGQILAIIVCSIKTARSNRSKTGR